MTDYFAPTALLPGRWATAVRICVDEAGHIAEVQEGAQANGCERLGGPVLPGMPNLHSHAFQRAMAGLTERAVGAGDDFWGWRQVMYGFLAVLQPEHVAAIAAQLYLEMVLQGYTAVGEFHYLHHTPDGAPYAERAELSHRVIEAAKEVGLGITHLPVLYARGGFQGEPLAPEQRRFHNDVAGLDKILTDLRAAYRDDPQVSFGLGLHSLRAAPPEMLRDAVALVHNGHPDAPIHIHAAEQQREVEQCREALGGSPVAWLMEHAAPDNRWCLVHATHMTEAETSGLAASGAVAGLCPTTEANLGDGLFALPAYLSQGGAWGIGGDSHVSVNPREELRWLEYGQRLMLRQRNVAVSAARVSPDPGLDTEPDGEQNRGTSPGVSTGALLYREALAGGSRALGRPIGRLAARCRADLIVLQEDHPALSGKSGDLLLDSAIFAAGDNPVRDVMIGGRWVVREGRHAAQETIEARYRDTLTSLQG